MAILSLRLTETDGIQQFCGVNVLAYVSRACGIGTTYTESVLVFKHCLQ